MKPQYNIETHEVIPIVSKWYRKTEEWWKKRTNLITSRHLSNGQTKIPAGTRVRVNRKFGGFGLISDPCPHCGIRVQIHGVHISDLGFIIPRQLTMPLRTYLEGQGPRGVVI